MRFFSTEKVLKRFCELLDLEYQDSMVNWTPIPEDQRDQFPQMGGAFKQAKETRGFLSNSAEPQVDQASTASALGEKHKYHDVIAAQVQKYTPIYQRFRELAIKV